MPTTEGGGAMAKQPDDVYTLELKLPARRGRPPKDDAMTPAQRAQRYRNRKKAEQRRLAGAMYVGPNGKTWSGRGQVPMWLRIAIERTGCSRDAFLAKR